ncbi:hypothetical protein IV203_011772 [Nitzschia inconspicua]|uniref:DUF6824 domain-containing protein n=1 Tax=Nitzschia inconspicua TaxID=303405 RepID=A0A9K3KSQ1_9STRA|nr:hypothetical protein IV203_011772 [Nitzschia inconspicua]
MNVAVMQQPTDLERKLLQQQKELQQLARSLQAFSGNDGNSAAVGFVSSALPMSSSSCVFNGSTNPLAVGNQHQSFAAASFLNQNDHRANPNFMEELSFFRNASITNHEPIQQQAGLSTSCTSGIGQESWQLSHPVPIQNNFSLPVESHEQAYDPKQSIEKKIRMDEATGLASSTPLTSSNQIYSPCAITSNHVNQQLHYIGPSEHGQDYYDVYDVLSGRGGGTNAHPGNRYFRDLINMNRRTYLKSRKNNKPAISRAIVQAVRAKGGKFLKKCETTGLWYEIGDDGAREKTSQALRQRAPEIRKLLFGKEPNEQKQQDGSKEESLQQQHHCPSHLGDAHNTQQQQQQQNTDCLLSLMAAEPTLPSVNHGSVKYEPSHSFSQY